uniref:COX6C domain-containing protein n=1 Tax=Caenorhabditis japonica TaxID=281687 RepID=A0A8R1DYC5_CAEJA
MASPSATRNMLHSYGKRSIYVSFAAAVITTVAFNAFYVWPRHNKYEQFFATYDPYTRMKEICAANKGYMHTCPKELAKLYEKKGKAVAEH